MCCGEKSIFDPASPGLFGRRRSSPSHEYYSSARTQTPTLQVLECDGACEAAIAGGIIAYDTGIREVQQRRLRYMEFHGLSGDSFISSCDSRDASSKKGRSLSAVVTRES